MRSTECRHSSAETGFSPAASSGKESYGDEDARSVGGDDQSAAAAGISVSDRADAHETQPDGPLSNWVGGCERDSETLGINGSHGAPHIGASRQPADDTSQVARTSPPHTTACNAVSSLPQPRQLLYVGTEPLACVRSRQTKNARSTCAQNAAMRHLQHRLEAALADVGRATAALAGAEARVEEAADDAAAARQDLTVALAEGSAAERRLASVAAAAEVRCVQGSHVPWFMHELRPVMLHTQHNRLKAKLARLEEQVQVTALGISRLSCLLTDLYSRLILPRNLVL